MEKMRDMSLYDDEGRVKDRHIAHEMAKTEDPYRTEAAQKKEGKDEMVSKSSVKEADTLTQQGEQQAVQVGAELIKQKREDEYRGDVVGIFKGKEFWVGMDPIHKEYRVSFDGIQDVGDQAAEQGIYDPFFSIGKDPDIAREMVINLKKIAEQVESEGGDVIALYNKAKEFYDNLPTK